MNIKTTSEEQATTVLIPSRVCEAPKDSRNQFKKAKLIPQSVPNRNEVINRMSNWKFFNSVQKLLPKLLLLIVPVDLMVNVDSAVTIRKNA